MGIKLLLATVIVAVPAIKAQQNVLLIIADDMGLEKIRAFGEQDVCGQPITTFPNTPRLDSLADNGVKFTRCWASPVCSPTRASIHTGQHVFRTGVGSAINCGSTTGLLRCSDVTIPEYLDNPPGQPASGYSHALFGKWHLDNANRACPDSPFVWGPRAHGWGYFKGIIDGGIGDYCAWRKWVQIEAGPPNCGAAQCCPIPGPNHFVYSTRSIANDAIAWINDQQGPWLCCVSFNAPHEGSLSKPYHAPPSFYYHGYGSRVSLQSPGETCGVPPGATNMQMYDAMIEAMDVEIERILQGIPEVVAANTNVIFVADNGTPRCASSTSFPVNHTKGSPYEPGIRVPLFVTGPAVTAPSTVVSDPVHVVDLFSTVIELAGLTPQAPPGETIDSVSLVPYLQGGTATRPWSCIFTDSGGVFLDPCAAGSQWPLYNHAGFFAVEANDVKLVRFGPDPMMFTSEELFDLNASPCETGPIVPPASHPMYVPLVTCLMNIFNS